jgi:DNA polymerase-3 subunit delta'
MPELSQIVGQQRAIDSIGQLLGSGRMPHAFIFAGPQGVGRRTTAMALAKTLLCSQPIEVPWPGATAAPFGACPYGAVPSAPTDRSPKFRQACGQCDDCRMMAAASHPDFHMIYKELARFHDDPAVRDRVMQELGIPVIKAFLLAPAYMQSTRGRGKVFIVRESELMSDAAQNALLKTLEEPPPAVTIILLCEHPQQLLPTTLSRCWPVRFGPLPRRFITDKLLANGVDPDEARFWSGFVEGSVGRALHLAKPALYKLKCEIISALAAIGPAGDSALADQLAKTCDNLADAAVRETHSATGADLSKNLAMRQAAGMVLQLIASAYRDAMSNCGMGDFGERSRAVPPASRGMGVPPMSSSAIGAPEPINADQPQSIAAIAKRFTPDQLAAILEHLSEYEELLWRNVSAKTVWDNVVITCATARAPTLAM